MVADDLFGASEDFVEGEGGGIEEDGVGGRAKGGFGSVAVAGIAVAEFLEDVLLGERLGGIGWESVVERWCGGGPVLVETTAAANFGGGVEEDFDFGVGEDGGTDVAAFHDDAAGLTEGALLGDHPDAEAGVDGDAGGGGGDVGVADAAADVAAVEEDAVAIAQRFELDGGVGGEVEEGLLVVEVEIAVDGLKGEGAVHGAGFEVEETEAAGQVGGDSGFPGTGGAIDGDHGTLATRSGIVGGGGWGVGHANPSA